MSTNTGKIQDLKRKIADLEAEDAAIVSMTTEERLADTLHSMLCNWNHTDGCGWFYEIKNGTHNWSGSSHGPYLRKAQSVTLFCHHRGISTDSVIELLKLTRE
jgi:hypothetical protein